MSENKNPIEKVIDTLDNVLKFQKFSKLKAAYVEEDAFKDSNLHEGHFCYNCIYWLDAMGGRCMLVSNEGPDVEGRVSGVVAPHGCCNGYEPNRSKIHDTRLR